MAFLRNCTKRCDWPGCSTVAKEELLTFRNERFGFYCSRHAQTKLRQVQKDEQALFARQRASS